MTLSASLANIVIQNNTIDQGRSTDGTTPVTYNYTYHCWTFGSSLISGNTFIAPSTSSDMLNLDNCTCIVSNNKFIRDATSINSYIRNYGSQEQTIVDNIFDSPTIDGSSEVIVVGLNDSSKYSRNTNQTCYAAINLGDGPWLPGTVYFGRGLVNTPAQQISANFSGFPSGGANSLMESLTYTLTNASVSTNYNAPMSFELNLNKYLPPNVRLINAVLGLTGDGTRSSPGTGADIAISGPTTSFSMSARGSMSLAYNPFSSGTLATSAADVNYHWFLDYDMTGGLANSNFILISTGPQVDAFIVNTQYLIIDGTSADLRLASDKLVNIRIEYAVVMQGVTVGTRSVRIRNSPLLVKYRW